MLIKLRGKKINIIEMKSLKDKIKSFKFILEPIDYGIVFYNKKIINTYFFCQRVDICCCDKNHKIIKLYEDFPSEKIRFIKNCYSIYYLPLNTCKYYDVGEIFKVKEQ